MVAFMFLSPVAAPLAGAAAEPAAAGPDDTADDAPDDAAADPPAGAAEDPAGAAADAAAEAAGADDDAAGVELELQAARARPPTRVMAASVMDFFTSTSMLFRHRDLREPERSAVDLNGCRYMIARCLKHAIPITNVQRVG